MNEKRIIVAIDGPSGVGKSSVSRELARHLKIPFLDTGAMYRTVALLALEHAVSTDDEQALLGLLNEHHVELELTEDGLSSRVRLDGEIVGEAIRSAEVSAKTSEIAVHAGIRERMVALQREFAHQNGGILEGRDIATVVVPNAQHKFFLEASPEVRAERRLAQRKEPGQTLSDLIQDIRSRDERDRSREISPLRVDKEHDVLDTSQMSFDEVVAEILARIQACSASSHTPPTA